LQSTAEKIKSFFGDTVNQIAGQTQFVQRQSKLDGLEFLQIVVFGFIENPKGSLNHLAQVSLDLGLEITPQGIDERVKLPGALRRGFLREEASASFARAGAAAPKSPALRQSKGLHLIPTASGGVFWLFPINEHSVIFLKEMFSQAMGTFKNDQPLPLEVLQQFRAISILDSSVKSLPDNMEEEYPGCGGDGPQASMNVPSTILTVVQVVLLYRVRWQIEMVFKLWKSYCGLRRIAGVRRERVLTELYAKMIGIVLTHFLIAPLRMPKGAGVNREISPVQVRQILRRFACQTNQALTNLDALVSVLEKTVLHIARFGFKQKREKNPNACHALDLVVTYLDPALLVSQSEKVLA
jgi:hypothetical protein